jgi:starvation-inducible DNA-binding protein
VAHETQSTLPEQDVKTVGEALQGALVDLVDLSLVAKQIHWNVYGPRFRSVHFQLDEVVDTARGYSDTVAERAAALGLSPDGRSASVSTGSTLDKVAEGWHKDTEAVRVMLASLATVVENSRERMASVGKVDPVTEDVFIRLTADLEKHRWMFAAENSD